MILKVLFINPNGGTAYVELGSVTDWKTDHGELLVFRGDSQTPDAIFAGRQWVWAERLEEKVDGARPPRRDRHFVTPAGGLRVSDKSPAASSVQFNIDGRPVLITEDWVRAVRDYERLIEEEHGPDAARAMPWNQVNRGDDRR